MSDPYATYARALLYIINGQRIEPDTSIVMPRTKHNANFKISEKYHSLPNPAQDHIFIQIENYQKDSEYRFQMYDVIGQFVNGGLLNEKTEIPGVSRCV